MKTADKLVEFIGVIKGLSPHGDIPILEKDWSFTAEEFIRQSNAIENIWTEDAVKESLEAWDFLKKQPVIGLPQLLECHRLILQNLDPEKAGVLRNYDVCVNLGTTSDLAPDKTGKLHFVTTRHKKVFAPHNSVKKLLNRLLMTVEPSDGMECLLAHIAFENIHPFGDGNGRSGRLLYLWHCKNADVHPILFDEKHKFGYYDVL